MYSSDKYKKQIKLFVSVSNNQEYIYDPYFCERKTSLDNTIKSVENGIMKIVDFNSSIDKLIALYSA